MFPVRPSKRRLPSVSCSWQANWLGKGAQDGIARSYPWLVAFTFGLLHGLGFAGALAEVGLPQGQIPTALLFFNIGVELGQVLFVAAVLAVMALIRSMRPVIPRWLEFVPPYAIGTLATVWVFQRVASLLTAGGTTHEQSGRWAKGLPIDPQR